MISFWNCENSLSKKDFCRLRKQKQIDLVKRVANSHNWNMMEYIQPPPATNFSVPPPPMQQQHAPPPQQNQTSPSVPHYQNHPRERHFHGGFSGKSSHFRSFNSFNRGQNNGMSQDDFDGKRLRKSVMRKTVDYNSSIVRALEVSDFFSLVCLVKV